MDMMKMMKQAAAMQKDMKKKQKMLSKQVVEFSAAGGAVVVKMSCDMKPQSVSISEELIKEGNVKKIESAVLDGVKGAINQAQADAAKEMKSLTKGLDLPF